MKRTKRASVAYFDAVGLLQDVLEAVPGHCYDSIAEVIHEFDTETDEPVHQRLYSVEKTLIDNLQPHPGLLRRFINFFPEEYQSSFDKKKRTNGVKKRTDVVNKSTNVVKKSTNVARKRPRRVADRTPVPHQSRELLSKLGLDQQLNCQKTLKLTKTINRNVKIPLLMEKFQQCLDSYNNKTIKLKVLLDEVCLLFIDNEHLLPLFIEFIVIDPQDFEGKAVLERFKEGYDQSDYTQDIEKLINHHLRYLRRLEAKVNNNSALRRVRALLALYTMEVLSFEQLKKIIRVSLKKEPPSAIEVIDELFESLEDLNANSRINSGRLNEELESLESTRRDHYLQPIRELDGSRLEPCSSTCFFLPSDYPTSRPSHRTSLGDSVLQDRVIGIPSLTEESETVHQKPVHENRLFEIEDEMHKVSLSLDLLDSTRIAIRAKSQLIQNMSETAAKEFLNENLNLRSIHLSCIRSLYGSRTDSIIAESRRNPVQGLARIHDSIELQIRHYKQAVAENGYLWRKRFKDSFQRSLDYTCQTFKFEEEAALSHQTLLGKAEINHPELPPLNGVNFKGHGAFKIGPTLLLNFSNKGTVDCAHWAVETALKVFYTGYDRENCWHFWEKLIVPFLQFDRVHQSTGQSTDRSGPAFRPNGISRRILANGGSGSLVYTERLLGRLRKTQRSSMYCSEALYLLFRYLDFLCKKFGVLGATVQVDSFKLRMIKDAISDFLSQKRESEEFEETLTKLAGNDVYPLFTIRELLRKLTTQIERLLTHPSIKFLEEQASAVLSSSSNHQIQMNQGCWTDEISYRRKLIDLCPGEKIFLCNFDHRNQELCIKRVFGETQESSSFNRISQFQSKELIPTPRQFMQNPVFLKRTRCMKYRKILNSRSLLQGSNPLKFDDLRHHMSSKRFRYKPNTAYLMISSNRKMPDAKLIEKKSVIVAAWLRKCAVLMESTLNRQVPSSSNGIQL